MAVEENEMKADLTIGNSQLTTLDYVDNDFVVNQVDVDDEHGRLQVRLRIDTFEQGLKNIIGESTDYKDKMNLDGLVEHFVQGVYIRELFIPKDSVIVSQLWRKERMWVIAYGDVAFVTEMGTQRIRAPFTKIVPPGSKVALYTYEDTLWFAIAQTNAKDSEAVKDDLIAKDYNGCVYPWDKEVKQ